MSYVYPIIKYEFYKIYNTSHFNSCNPKYLCLYHFHVRHNWSNYFNPITTTYLNNNNIFTTKKNAKFTFKEINHYIFILILK